MKTRDLAGASQARGWIAGLPEGQQAAPEAGTQRVQLVQGDVLGHGEQAFGARQGIGRPGAAGGGKSRGAVGCSDEMTEGCAGVAVVKIEVAELDFANAEIA